MEITTKSFKKEVLESNIPVLLECWASWCLPCKQIEPALEQLSEKYIGKCKVLKVNIDKNPTISKKYSVRGLPTFVIFTNGEEQDRLVGAQTYDVLSELLEKAINNFKLSSLEN